MKALAIVAAGLMMAPGSCDPGNSTAWIDVEPGAGRQPTISIDDAVYPNDDGVQFLINGEVDDRCSCRPNGFDATGPQENSTYHIYPDVDLDVGDVLVGRWTDDAGTAHESEHVVAEPAPPPTTDPPPPPAPSGERPSRWNTGHDGKLTRTFGSTQVTQSWLDQNNGGSRTIEDVLFTGGVKVLVDNVTIRNFEVRGGRYGVDSNVFNGSVSGLVLEDGVITESQSSGLLVKNTIARRLEIYEMGADAVKGFGNVTMENSYIHRLGTNEGAHADGVQIRSGSGYRFVGNYFYVPTRLEGYENSIAILLQTADGPIDDVLIERNWFNGGGYSVHNRGDATNDRLIDNLFTREHLFGPVVTDTEWTEIRGNTYFDGTPI